MLKSVWDDIVKYFRTGGIVPQLLLINIAVFIGLSFLSLFMGGAGFVRVTILDFLQFFGLSPSLKHIAFHPWSLFTHMFMHISFGHIFGNMIMLYVFGQIVENLLGRDRILALYIMGGLVGGLCYVLAAALGLTPQFSFAIGASASVMAFVVAAGFLAPEQPISLIFFTTKLKFVMLGLVLLDLLGAAAQEGNTGHIAHLGGAFFGWFFVHQMREKGNDLSLPFNKAVRWIQSLFLWNIPPPAARRPKPKMAFKNHDRIRSKDTRPGRQSDYNSIQERIDAILDKINKKGMASLTDEEKDFLHKNKDQL